MNRLWALLCLLLLAAGPAFAETRSVGYAIWNVNGGTARVLYMLPDSEKKSLVAPGAPTPNTKQVADYVLKHLSVIRQGMACMVVDQGQDVGLINTLALTLGLLRFEMLFQCADGEGLILSDSMFSDRMPNHVDYARVQIGNGGFSQHVFSASDPRLSLPAPSDSFLRYASLGLFHVLRSTDILCFMLALLLIVRRRRDFEYALGALALGYCVSILLGAFHLAAPRFAAGNGPGGLLIFVAAGTALALSLPDPRRGALALGAGAVALALAALFFHGTAAAFAVLGVACLGVSALFVPGRENQRALFLLIAPFVFALLDGFTLSSDLAILALPPAQLAPMLIGFNAATLVGAALLPLCLTAVWLGVPRVRWTAAPGGFLPDLTAAAIIGCGMFWFASWLFI